MGRVNPVAEQLKQAGFDVKTYNPKNFRSSLGNLNRLDVKLTVLGLGTGLKIKVQLIDIELIQQNCTSPFVG